jgi:tRNA nucleotidyltransferase (CCA-adding enzyme)
VTRDPVIDRLDAAVPANVRTVCETLSKAGHAAVCVGGAVRDAMLEKQPGDWDVATSAKPEAVIALFRHTVPTGLKHGTVTIVTGRGIESHVEVTTFRGEGGYSDGRRPDHVTFGVPLDEDLARRDFRINAMAYDPANHTLHDPYAGRRDLEEGVIRAVGPTGNVYEDAVARFSEDGLRVMRAVRFAAQLEFALDPETERGIVPALPVLAKVSRERVSDELRKILAARRPSLALLPALRTGILASIARELVAALEVRRASSASVSAEEWETSVKAAEAAVWFREMFEELASSSSAWAASVDAAEPAVRLGAMFAELAAPSETRRSDRAAVKRAEAVLRRLKFANDEIAAAAALVGAAGATVVAEWTEPEVRRLLADVTRAHAPLAVQLWRVKQAAQLADLGAAILARGDALDTGGLAITGTDLISELALVPGRVVGQTLAALLERVLVDHTLNTRDQLLALARAQIS